MAAITQVKGSLARRSGGLVRPTLGKRGITLVRPSLGILTPQATLDRARSFNNNLQALSRAVTGQSNKDRLNRQWNELRPVMMGWMDYYYRLKNNTIAQAAEYGELEEWEKTYVNLRTKFASEGLDVSAVPVIAVGSTPGKVKIPEQIEVEVQPGDTPEQIRQKAQEASEKFVADFQSMLLRVGLYGAGALLVGLGIYWVAKGSKKGRGVSGLGYTSAQHFEYGENAIDDLNSSIETLKYQMKQGHGCKVISRRLQEASMDAERAGQHFWSAKYDPKATAGDKRTAENLLDSLSHLNRELRWLNKKFEHKCLE